MLLKEAMGLIYFKQYGKISVFKNNNYINLRIKYLQMTWYDLLHVTQQSVILRNARHQFVLLNWN